MKKKLEIMPVSDLLLEAPAYPHTSNFVFSRLKGALEASAGSQADRLTLKQLGRLIGAPRSTFHDWYHGNLPKPIGHFLCALERLSEGHRVAVLRELCRDYPQLAHQRLAHDEQSVNVLMSLISQKTGLTLIVGPNDALRTFVITALGNTAIQMFPTHPVTGLDVHRPDNFVPVPGVRYLRRPKDARQMQPLLKQVWSWVERSTATLVLVNGVASTMPELCPKIEALAERKHVIVADDSQDQPRVSPESVSTILTVTATTSRLLRVRMQAGPLNQD